jgi:hypothetical protein
MDHRPRRIPVTCRDGRHQLLPPPVAHLLLQSPPRKRIAAGQDRELDDHGGGIPRFADIAARIRTNCRRQAPRRPASSDRRPASGAGDRFRLRRPATGLTPQCQLAGIAGGRRPRAPPRSEASMGARASSATSRCRTCGHARTGSGHPRRPRRCGARARSTPYRARSVRWARAPPRDCNPFHPRGEREAPAGDRAVDELRRGRRGCPTGPCQVTARAFDDVERPGAAAGTITGRPRRSRDAASRGPAAQVGFRWAGALHPLCRNRSSSRNRSSNQEQEQQQQEL